MISFEDYSVTHSASGIIIQAIRYAINNEVPLAKKSNTANNLTNETSMLEYIASPEHTPPSTLSLAHLNNLFDWG